MPQVGGKHYSYTRQFGGKTFRSTGQTYSKAGAKRAAERYRNTGGVGSRDRRHRVVRLGQTSKYAVYSSVAPRSRIPKGPYG